MKTLKFKTELAQEILAGQKTSTWRLFDDKDLDVGDKLELINSDTGQPFAQARINKLVTKKLSEVTPQDYFGHETYANREEMLATFRGYYADRVTLDTTVKIIYFELV